MDLADGLGRRVLISPDGDGRLRYSVLDGHGQEVVSESRLDRTISVDLGQPATTSEVWSQEADETAKAVSRISRELLSNITMDSRVTASRMTSAFTAFRAMLWATFGVGIGAFVAAVVKGLTASDDTSGVLTTVVFGGLSATAFVAAFISRPSSTMGEAGLRAAWAQTIVTTYWSKLAYMSDPSTVLVQLEKAQRDVNRSMSEYFTSLAAQPDPPAEDSRADAGGSGTSG